MERLFPRCNASLNIRISVPGNGGHLYKAETADMGLGGGFIKADLPLAAGEIVIVHAELPDFGPIQAKSRIIRKNGCGFAVEFLGLNTDARSELWRYLKDKCQDSEACPYCGSAGIVENICTVCTRDMDLLRRPDYGVFEQETHRHSLVRLREATDELVSKLEQIDRFFAEDASREDEAVRAVTETLQEAYDVFRMVEQVLAQEPELLREQQVLLRNRTDHLVRQSYFLNRARVWPQGHPGDYRIIESVYRNIPLSGGIGLLLDRYFLNNILARAVRARKQKMGQILLECLESGGSSRVLNIGCGSCRELFEIVNEIRGADAVFTCVDMDADALAFAADRFALTELADRFRFHKYNVLRMVNAAKNRQEFGMQSLVYSIGVLDYLDDDVLLRLIPALYDLVLPGGKLVVAFKDGDRYRTQDYHWMVDWNQFKQRSFYESRTLLESSGIPDDRVVVSRDESGVIIFYSVDKPA